jgi:hypothetical protein
MPCYEPVPALLRVDRDGRRRLVFSSVGVGQGITLPCGYCLGCRLERARQWAVRIMHESKMHSENSFITLTYDEKHLPAGGTLSVEDCQLFLKRLRDRISPVRIKFFLCGEYGESMGRPHYHAIVFGYGFPDRKLYSRSKDVSTWTSLLLSETWGLGSTRLGSVSWDSALYVANYATKKVRTNKAAEEQRLAGRKPEFLLMSRGGRSKGSVGIGGTWLEKFHTDVFPSDQCIVRGRAVRPPLYYYRWLEARNPSAAARVRLAREKYASNLEKVVLASGREMMVSPSRNARRLKMSETIARAKLALKMRSLEEQNNA